MKKIILNIKVFIIHLLKKRELKMRKCKYNNQIVYFHCFNTEPFQELTFNGELQWVQYPVAIIEFEDGHVETVSATSIIFIEEKKYMGLGDK
jgi:hypothetical protein